MQNTFFSTSLAQLAMVSSIISKIVNVIHICPESKKKKKLKPKLLTGYIYSFFNYYVINHELEQLVNLGYKKNAKLVSYRAWTIPPSRVPWWLSGKESACSAGDLGLIPGLERSPGERHGNPVQYSCLENFMGRGAWWATVHRIAELDTTEATRRQQQQI